MDEIFCPHFWMQVVLPTLQSVLPFISGWMHGGVAAIQKIRGVG